MQFCGNKTILYFLCMFSFQFNGNLVADVVVTFSSPTPSSVQLTVVGSIDTTGWTAASSMSTFSGVTFRDNRTQITSDAKDGVNFRNDNFSSFDRFGTAPEAPGSGTIFTSPQDPEYYLGIFISSLGDRFILPDFANSDENVDLDFGFTYTGFTLDDFGLTIGDNWGVLFPVLESSTTSTGVNQSMTFRVVAVPEPSACCVLLVCQLVLLRRRKRSMIANRLSCRTVGDRPIKIVDSTFRANRIC